ncbi:843_t:CDS:2 [Paraglomus occultum]|uniref:843_t:CDS:1 n=1 Tax=Paraglomus occultum TaxID=144539 RepID=A0A9N9CK09_9GLOM|nr:843_t:CDS:2 [Paraglomus occultum]
MGKSISKLVNDSTDRECKEALRFLRTAVLSKLKSFEQELLNPPSNNHTVPIGTIVDKMQDIHVNASKSGDALSNEINKTLDSLFSGDTAAALKIGVSATVKAFIGATEIGESTHRDYHIYVQDNALIRLDILLYRFNFSSENILRGVHSVNGYLFYKSIINHSEVSRDVMVYEITRFVRNYMKATAFTKSSKLDEEEVNNEVAQYLERLHSLYRVFENYDNDSGSSQILKWKRK